MTPVQDSIPMGRSPGCIDLLSDAGDDDAVMMEMNTTPLIDVMLVLIIMFIITLPIQLHAVNIALPPVAAQPATPPPQAETIDIDAEGQVHWNGVLLADRAALEAHWRRVAALVPQPEVHLRPDRATPYRVVAGVLSSAQRLGVNRLGVAGHEQFAAPAPSGPPGVTSAPAGSPRPGESPRR